MDSYAKLSGETRLIGIVGDPIAQVKSPAGVTKALLESGRNAVVIPVHVSPPDLERFVNGISLAKNFDGLLVTVPHKFAATRFCATLTDRARFLGAVNVMRRNADGSWHGDMVDGPAFVGGIRKAGCRPEGQRALLVGAGGAGSAIALALLEAGVAELAIHDEDKDRRDSLVERLRTRFGSRVRIGSSDPTGFKLVANATPVGMRPDDPMPVQADKFTADMFVGDVITAPAVTPMIEAARRAGCGTQIGLGMFQVDLGLMFDVLVEEGPLK
ncbi:shikimate dehydrogenase family protein [Noviherbaspirillum denitrificans]|uniref:Shikimate dehydrogenase n=1 Tax=Noviherbaspirillum denitrificans TaxID=1968433 RepID=A0A254TG34_9BURK|nr:shikimate dehydrogenase [Noviherbaspirillum denitrificans]OWW21621.1 shikimate dehydrogenase [Noviherbaspirillum denitrificans]